MLPVKKLGRNIYFERLCWGPPNLKLRVSVTQTSVVAVVADHSTHAIYHIKDN